MKVNKLRDEQTHDLNKIISPPMDWLSDKVPRCKRCHELNAEFDAHVKYNIVGCFYPIYMCLQAQALFLGVT